MDLAQRIGLTTIWKYRGFISGSIKRELQSKYSRSLLGGLWTIISPLSMILVYTVIFSAIMQARLPSPSFQRHGGYGIYLCAGILPWGLFAEIINRSTTMFIDNAEILKKLSFPRLSLPIIVLLNSLINFGTIFTLFLAYLIISGNFPGLCFTAVVPLTILLAAFAMGLGITMGIMNVFFRDVGQLSSIALQFWFWLTPIVYTLEILPDWAQKLVAINPIAAIISGYQKVIVTGSWPNWSSLMYPAVMSILLCHLGYRLFIDNSVDIVDEL